MASVLPGGRGVRRAALGRLRWPLAIPERRLGHTPPPPRPFGRFGGIVAVDADRLVRKLLTFHPPEGRHVDHS